MVSTVKLKGCQPRFLLHFLLKISREHVTLRKKLKQPLYQAFTQFSYIKNLSVNLKMNSLYEHGKKVIKKMSRNNHFFMTSIDCFYEYTHNIHINYNYILIIILGNQKIKITNHICLTLRRSLSFDALFLHYSLPEYPSIHPYIHTYIDT